MISKHMEKIPLFFNRSLLDRGTNASIYWDYKRTPHMLVIGSTGSGKSYAVKGIMGKIVKYLPNGSITVCDYKSEDYAFLKNLPNYYAFDNCTDGLNQFFSEFQKRQNGEDNSRSMKLLVFDEWASFLAVLDKKEATEAQKKLSTLLMLGRSFNVHILVSVQRADSTYFERARDNFSVVIALGNLSKESALMFGFDRDLMTNCSEAGQGHILYNGANMQPIIVPKIRDMDFLEKTIAKAVK